MDVSAVLTDRCAFKWGLIEECFVERNTEAELIGGLHGDPRGFLLGSHVFGSSEPSSRLSQGCELTHPVRGRDDFTCDFGEFWKRGRSPCEAKVGDANPPVGPEQNVFGLEITVNETRFMSGGQPSSGVDEAAEGLLP